MSKSDAGSTAERRDAEDAVAESRDADDEATEHRPDSTAGTTAGSRWLERLTPAVLVAVGGFAGAALRYVVAVGLPNSFPWGTLAVNVAGSFALGVLLYEARVAGRLGPETRLLVGTGFLSSFTTYSTFAVQTAALSPTLAVVNVGANYALGFAAVLTGRAVVREVAR